MRGDTDKRDSIISGLCEYDEAKNQKYFLKKTLTSVSLKKTMILAKTPQDKTAKSSFINFFKIWKYSATSDKLIMLFGCLMAILNGLCWPTLNYVMGIFVQELSNMLKLKEKLETSTVSSVDCSSFIDKQSPCLNDTDHQMGVTIGNNTFPSESEWLQKLWNYTIPAATMAIIQIITGYLTVLTLNYSSERIGFRIRRLFMRNLLKQEIAWFDSRQQGDIISNLIRYMNLIQTAIGEKFGLFLMSVSLVTASIAIAFTRGWQLTLVMFCMFPISITIVKLNNRFQHRMHRLIRAVNAEVAFAVQEVIGAIRTVVAFGGEQKEIGRFQQRLRLSNRLNKKHNTVSGFNFSIIFFITQCFIALGFWYGMKLQKQYKDPETGENYEYNVQDIMMINVMLLMSGVYIRQSIPLLELISSGLRAATLLFDVIEQKPVIDSSATCGKRVTNIHGAIELVNIHFRFQGSSKILRGLDLSIPASKTTALVGGSGSGKSTILQLIQRFYDPEEGHISLDGIDIKELNIGWLRGQIGVVSQEPILFNTTVMDNIRYGNENATHEDVVKAAKEANAHDFIMKLPQQYKTRVGEQGGQLSGGQRQRIAIARALIRNPRILILDEATSALDNESEAIVQESLDRAQNGRTTVVVAHRLSTIRNADKIVVIQKGQVVEEGTHDELVDKEGAYFQLLLKQHGNGAADLSDDDDDDDDDNEALLAESTDDNDDESEDEREDLLEIIRNQTLSAAEVQIPKTRVCFWKIILLSLPDWPYVFGALLFSVLFSFSHAARSYVFATIAEMVVVESHQSGNRAMLFPCIYIAIGFLSFTASALRSLTQSETEESLLFRIRNKTFSSMLQQDMAWFDNPKRKLGSLCSLINNDAETVKKLVGTIFCTWMYGFFAVISVVVLSFILNWKLTLPVAAVSFCVFFSHYVKGRIAQGGMLAILKCEEDANNIANEAVRNIRTVIGLHIQDLMARLYELALGKPRKFWDRSNQLRALVAGLSEGFMLIGFNVCLSYGSYLMYKGEATFLQYNAILSLMIVNLMEVSFTLASSPSFTRACISADKVLKVIERQPQIDNNDAAGLKLPEELDAEIEFKDVRFAYPTRPNTYILQGMNLKVECGKTVAFVGKSGCGKSTSLQLLQRFYDASYGKVSINGYDVRNLNVKNVRKLIGIVSQEPVLFNRSIAENIAYGDNSRSVCMHEIIDAARKANIHEFIKTLPQAYETRIGQRGIQLSGGQKQRIAIARALLRNPSILLLDEATSALDNESEKIVQKALEEASKGRTCIIIAHRLSTIQNADEIVVFHQGQIVERGTHDSLTKKKGLYYESLQIQAGRRRSSRVDIIDGQVVRLLNKLAATK